MNTFTKVLFFAATVVFFAACSASKPLTMDMSVEKGANFDYAITTSSDMGMAIMGQDMSVTGESMQNFNFMVKEVNPTGVSDIDFKISRMTVDFTMPMVGDMSYDSDKGAEKDSPFNSLGGLIGKTMEANLNRQGKVTSIEGADALLKQVLGKMKGGDQLAGMLEGYIGESAFKNVFASITGFSQGKALKVGDTWSKSVETSSGVNMMSDYTYTIRERDGGKVTIDVTGKAKTDPKAEPIEAQGMKITYSLEGPITGTIVVDEKTGWATTSDNQQDLSGKMTMGGTPMGDMKIDAKMKIGTSAVRK
ncbi:MAG: DUF6263 family protein [Bacteroidota bacterium]